MEFTAPEFRISQVELAWQAGEPTIVSDPTGNLLVTGPSCIRDLTCMGNPNRQDAAVFESRDRGLTWFVHNQAPDGQLAPRPGNATTLEAHIAVDAVGRRYLFDMVDNAEPYAEVEGVNSTGSYARLFRSPGPGQAWEYLRDIHGSNGMDRPWVAAEGNGHVLLGWNGDGIPILESWDAGETWSNEIQTCGNCGLPGPPVWDAGWARAFVPVFMPPAQSAQGEVPSLDTGIGVVRQKTDGTWQAMNSGSAIKHPLNAGLFAANIFAVAAVTDDGHVVVAWSQYDGDPTGYAFVTGTSVWFASSPDGGASWSPATRISTRANAILPWITAGGGDRFAVAYYTTDTPGDPNRAYSATWDLAVAVVQDASPTTHIIEVVVEPAIHLGSICTGGTSCVGNDRYTMLDFLSVTTLPDGALAVAYIVDDDDIFNQVMRLPGASRSGLLHVAIQTAGSPLFVPLRA